MAERVYWHVGLPKTGTTYLQQILWANTDALAAEGITMPGRGHREHLWAALDMQDDPSLARRDARATGAWERLAAQTEAASGTVLLSHEFFSAATTEQAQRAADRLAPAEIHLVVTARDAAGMLAAGWQESVKNGAVRGLRSTAERDQQGGHFGWWVWDLEQVLRRWLPVVDAERIHVLPVPDRSEGPDQHWHQFARTIGLQGRCVMPQRPLNQSLGVVQVEALRKVNAHRTGFDTALERGEWLRGYLGEDHLARQSGGGRLLLDDDLFEECRERSLRAHQLVTERGIDVVGDPARLAGPTSPSGDRTVGSVTPLEVADALAELVGTMLHDVRDRTVARNATPAVAPALAVADGSLLSRVRGRWDRLRNS
ncbi:hypothetical protein [Nocardioides jishulii]|uniref:Sulfotransferase family protein n=1 Tax=Nocardioides jishulii TaxID=2575440 RepID=A0A4U2YIC7_9ACTN|nr:hypothetical protein [Nocardioides jishulii]QCX28182.1 hypothetical protein FCL41_12130 [Nocardioides jishulii]TKI60846.1 hypothetical protein FC770_15200 [Nocardioides jishulii]